MLKAVFVEDVDYDLNREADLGLVDGRYDSITPPPEEEARGLGVDPIGEEARGLEVLMVLWMRNFPEKFCFQDVEGMDDLAFRDGEQVKLRVIQAAK